MTGVAFGLGAWPKRHASRVWSTGPVRLSTVGDTRPAPKAIACAGMLANTRVPNFILQFTYKQSTLRDRGTGQSRRLSGL